MVPQGNPPQCSEALSARYGMADHVGREDHRDLNVSHSYRAPSCGAGGGWPASLFAYRSPEMRVTWAMKTQAMAEAGGVGLAQ